MRDKMLYSSSKEDLKRNLGAGYFKAEYSANVIADVTWDSYIASLERGLDLDLLTETEKLLLEERVSVAMCTCLYVCMYVCMYVVYKASIALTCCRNVPFHDCDRR